MACPRAGGPFRGRRRPGTTGPQPGGRERDKWGEVTRTPKAAPTLPCCSRGPEDRTTIWWVCRPGCTRSLGICWFAVVPGLLGHRGSLAATSMRSTPGAPTIWLDRVGLGVRRRTQQPPPVIAVGFYGAWTRYPKRPRMYFTRSGDEERGYFDSLHRAGRRLMLCWFGQRPPDSSAFGKGCVWLASSSEMVAPRAAASSSSVGTASRTDGGRAS